MSEEYIPSLVEYSFIFVMWEVTYFSSMPFRLQLACWGKDLRRVEKRPEIPSSNFLGVTEFQAWRSIQVLHKGVGSWIQRQTGTVRFLSVCHQEGILSIFPRNGGLECVGPDDSDVLHLDQHMEMEKALFLELNRTQ